VGSTLVSPIVEEVVHADVLLTLLLWLFFYRHGTVFPSASGRVAAQDAALPPCSADLGGARTCVLL
jgi:hypothetical protein